MTTFHQTNNVSHIPPLEYYLNLQYPITLYPNTEGGYVAEIKDLPGCFTQGKNLEETINNLNEAKELWLITTYKAQDIIPLPQLE